MTARTEIETDPQILIKQKPNTVDRYEWIWAVIEPTNTIEITRGQIDSRTHNLTKQIMQRDIGPLKVTVHRWPCLRRVLTKQACLWESSCLNTDRKTFNRPTQWTCWRTLLEAWREREGETVPQRIFFFSFYSFFFSSEAEHVFNKCFRWLFFSLLQFTQTKSELRRGWVSAAAVGVVLYDGIWADCRAKQAFDTTDLAEVANQTLPFAHRNMLKNTDTYTNSHLRMPILFIPD